MLSYVENDEVSLRTKLFQLMLLLMIMIMMMLLMLMLLLVSMMIMITNKTFSTANFEAQFSDLDAS